MFIVADLVSLNFDILHIQKFQQQNTPKEYPTTYLPSKKLDNLCKSQNLSFLTENDNNLLWK